jgi:hypothetical protein
LPFVCPLQLQIRWRRLVSLLGNPPALVTLFSTPLFVPQCRLRLLHGYVRLTHIGAGVLDELVGLLPRLLVRLLLAVLECPAVLLDLVRRGGLLLFGEASARAAYFIPGGYMDKFVVGVFVDFKLPARPPLPVVVILI